jgi:hypothetical protein
MRRSAIGLVFAHSALALACSGDPVDIGDEQPPTGETLVDFAADWDGYTEAFQFVYADSDRLRLTIDAAASGTLQIGEGAASVPAVDPEVAPYGPWSDPNYTALSEHHLVPGFAYPLHDVSVERQRVRFMVDAFDLVRPWCQAQTPRLVSGTYTCGYENWTWPSDPADPCTVDDPNTPEYEQIPIDCGKAFVCDPAMCGCSETGCDIAADATFLQVSFDAALEAAGDSLVGTLVLISYADGQPLSVVFRMARQ